MHHRAEGGLDVAHADSPEDADGVEGGRALRAPLAASAARFASSTAAAATVDSAVVFIAAASAGRVERGGGGRHARRSGRVAAPTATPRHRPPPSPSPLASRGGSTRRRRRGRPPPTARAEPRSAADRGRRPRRTRRGTRRRGRRGADEVEERWPNSVRTASRRGGAAERLVRRAVGGRAAEPGGERRRALDLAQQLPELALVGGDLAPLDRHLRRHRELADEGLEILRAEDRREEHPRLEEGAVLARRVRLGDGGQPVPVVRRAALRVGEGLVGVRHLHEPGRRVGVVGVLVGVEFERLAVIAALDRRLGRRWLDAESDVQARVRHRRRLALAVGARLGGGGGAVGLLDVDGAHALELRRQRVLGVPLRHLVPLLTLNRRLDRRRRVGDATRHLAAAHRRRPATTAATPHDPAAAPAAPCSRAPRTGAATSGGARRPPAATERPPRGCRRRASSARRDSGW